MDTQTEAQLDTKRRTKYIESLNAQQHTAFQQYHTVTEAQEKYREAMNTEQKEEMKMQHAWAEAKWVALEPPERTTQWQARNADGDRKSSEKMSKEQTAQ